MVIRKALRSDISTSDFRGIWRVLVTGGAGLIGSHVCDAFIARCAEVQVVDDLSSGRAGRLPEGAAFLAAAEHVDAGIWNIGNGIEVSVLELATMIARITGDSTEPQFSPPRTGELQRSALVSEQAERDLGWRPSVPLADGVGTVVKWLAAGAPDRVSP